MELDRKLNESLKKAMKARDQVRLRTLRSIKAAFHLAKTAEGASQTLSGGDEVRILQKLYKQRKDSSEIYREQGRSDLAKKEEEEMEVIASFLPAQLDDTALVEAVGSIIRETGADSVKDIGKVMGVAMNKLGAQADGKRISAMVKRLLAG